MVSRVLKESEAWVKAVLDKFAYGREAGRTSEKERGEVHLNEAREGGALKTSTLELIRCGEHEG